MEEYEEGLAAKDVGISYSLSEKKDRTFTNWDCSIIGPIGSSLADRNLELTIYCDENYPLQPPQVNFVSKVKLPSDNEDGAVTLPGRTANWKGADMGIKDILIELRREIESDAKNYQQPEENEKF